MKPHKQPAHLISNWQIRVAPVIRRWLRVVATSAACGLLAAPSISLAQEPVSPSSKLRELRPFTPTPSKPANQLTANIAPAGKVLPPHSIDPGTLVINPGEDTRVVAGNQQMLLCREPACLDSRPLAFEDVPLERLGKRVAAQPAVSAAKFFGVVPLNVPRTPKQRAMETCVGTTNPNYVGPVTPPGPYFITTPEQPAAKNATTVRPFMALQQEPQEESLQLSSNDAFKHETDGEVTKVAGYEPIPGLQQTLPGFTYVDSQGNPVQPVVVRRVPVATQQVAVAQPVAAPVVVEQVPVATAAPRPTVVYRVARPVDQPAVPEHGREELYVAAAPAATPVVVQSRAPATVEPQRIVVQPARQYTEPRAVQVVEQPRTVQVVEQPRPVQVVEQPRPAQVVEQPRTVQVVEQPRPVQVVEQPRPVQVVEAPRPVQVVEQPRTQPEKIYVVGQLPQHYLAANNADPPPPLPVPPGARTPDPRPAAPPQQQQSVFDHGCNYDAQPSACEGSMLEGQCSTGCSDCSPYASVETLFFAPLLNNTQIAANAFDVVGAWNFATPADGLSYVGVSPRVTIGMGCYGGRGIRTRFWQMNNSYFNTDPLSFANPNDFTGFTSFGQFKAYTFDIEATHEFCFNRRTVLGFIGARYAGLSTAESLYAQVRTRPVPDILTAQATARTQFYGTGLTWGLQVIDPLWQNCCGGDLDLFVSGRGSAMFGPYDSAVASSAQVGGAGIYAISNNLAQADNTATLLIGELQAGLQWSQCVKCCGIRRFFGRVAFEYQYWGVTNPLITDTTSFAGRNPVDQIQITANRRNLSNINLVGLSLSAGCYW